MHKKLILICLSFILAATLALPFAAALSGCAGAPTAQMVTVKTLASVGKSTQTAVAAYFDLVLAGTIKTNSVPKVAKAFSDFQLAYGAAVALARSNTNAIATAGVLGAAANVTEAIASAK